VHYLTLQVSEVYDIIIDQGQGSDSRSSQVQNRRGGQAACAYDQDARRAYPLLAFDADVVEQDMARIARQLVIAHGGFILL
jgi:hypothetical protein